MLTHYTRTAEAVANILMHGFAWFPNRRRLAHLLVPWHDFSKREPQQFGMVSFTENEPPNTKAHCEEFGFFGIMVSDQWANEKNAQRVIYIDKDGPATDAWRNLFENGYRDLQCRIKYPDDGFWLMAYENKDVASAVAGSILWDNLLQLWEYMEPASVARQREWRIVNPEPLYSLSESKAEAIQQVSPPQNWAKLVNVVPIPRSEIKALICPPGHVQELMSVLPESYRNVTIRESDR